MGSDSHRLLNPELNHRLLAVPPSVDTRFYLLHQNIGYIIMRYLFQWHADPLLVIGIPIGCVLLLATAITFYVERPALKAMRAHYKQPTS